MPLSLCRPALGCGVLDGIMRGELIARARGEGIAVLEVHADLQSLYAAEGVFLTSSLIGLRAVSAVDGRKLAISPMVDDLAVAVD